MGGVPRQSSGSAGEAPGAQPLTHRLAHDAEGRPPFTPFGTDSRVPLLLNPGTSRALSVEFDPLPGKDIARLEIGLLPPSDAAMMDRAVAAAVIQAWFPGQDIGR